MGQLKEDVFLCFDCETTGLEIETDKIIELAAVTFTFNEHLSSFESLINPQCSIPEESIKIHHITNDMVAHEPTLKEKLPEFLKMAEGHILVGHGIQFDISIVANRAKQLAIPCSIQTQPFIDTLRLARLYGQSQTNSLEKLREHFNIPAEGAHRAMSDVTVNIEVFKQLAKDFRTTESLMKRLEKPILLKAMPLGKHKGRPFQEIPIEYLRWAARQNFDQDLLFSLRQELSKRKKGNPFAQASNPFSDLLP